MVSAKCRVRLSVFVEIRRDSPAAVAVVQIEDHAFANVDEETDIYAASAQLSVSTCVQLLRYEPRYAGISTGQSRWK